MLSSVELRTILEGGHTKSGAWHRSVYRLQSAGSWVFGGLHWAEEALMSLANFFAVCSF